MTVSMSIMHSSPQVRESPEWRTSPTCTFAEVQKAELPDLISPSQKVKALSPTSQIVKSHGNIKYFIKSYSISSNQKCYWQANGYSKIDSHLSYAYEGCVASWEPRFQHWLLYQLPVWLLHMKNEETGTHNNNPSMERLSIPDITLGGLPVPTSSPQPSCKFGVIPILQVRMLRYKRW